MDKVELSLVVPILNERLQLPEFFANLNQQQDIKLELVICDGGSTDGSWEWLQQQHPDWTDFKVLQCPSGRGQQQNRAAAIATGEWLLFLHVDSRFSDPLTLRKGLDFLLRVGSENVAGHFALKFRREDQSLSGGYYFYEWKARLGRPETIHGDQGFFLHQSLLKKIGSFSEELPAMEDTDFAERLRRVGQWQLLPAEISTSARRFETEGLWQRQLLGSLIMCFRTIGWNHFFTMAPGVYRQQQNSEKLLLLPFFQLIRKLLNELSFQERWKFWWLGGEYIRTHAWQLFFAVDARCAYRQGIPVGTGRLKWLDFFEPVYDFLTRNLLGRLGATLLLRSWFELTSLWLSRVEKKRVA
ncbi:MAG: TIGR04283 family arsenosugar biosynthesis glycosyltransferase [Desulfuromusa sp.]|nr:TIGR04283 family arsenosugar biosynthesis glycosyltransferase [Desulfuromusa sp.]